MGMPQLCVGNQAYPHDWDVASCSGKYKYDFNNINKLLYNMGTLYVNIEAGTQPINFPTVLRHAPCYLLEGDINRNLKVPVPTEEFQL